jgi:hypothetical protein
MGHLGRHVGASSGAAGSAARDREPTTGPLLLAMPDEVVPPRADGGPIGYSRVAIRWLVSIVSAAVTLLGYFWMLWDPEKQTWHDKAAGSIVRLTAG